VSDHDHILCRYLREDAQDESGSKEKLRKILKELEELTNTPGVGSVARDLDDILNAPVTE
jgi:hypothetical protein